MKKTSKIATLTLLTCIAMLVVTLPAKAQGPPPVPMTVSGYVTIHKLDGTNVTAPAGLHVYAKEDTTITNAAGDWTTDSNGHYNIGCSASEDGKSLDIWVEDTNVTRITFQSGTFLELNLTVT
jgi:hypothetical protein